MASPPSGKSDKTMVGPFAVHTELHKSFLGSLCIGRVTWQAGDFAGRIAAVRRIAIGADVDEQAANRVAEAAQGAAALEHENLVRIYGVTIEEQEVAVASAYHEVVYEKLYILDPDTSSPPGRDAAWVVADRLAEGVQCAVQVPAAPGVQA